MKVVTVVGARPQFIKAAAVSRILRGPLGRRLGLEEYLVHTGQHYDRDMSAVFFEEMGIPPPDVDLGVGSSSHGAMTARMLEGLEDVFIRERPGAVLVYGDTNSTLAGALAAAKLGIPIAHVEAGLRSFNRGMPEEINRVLTDHVSALLLCPTAASVDNLRREGIVAGVELVGDVMYDAALHYAEMAATTSTVLSDLGLRPRGFALATVHRQENTDDSERLESILRGLGRLATEAPVVLPIHPRTRAAAGREGLASLLVALRVVDPIGYLDMVALERAAAVIVTDSGGVQKEAFFYGVPCVTLRDETEWVETVEAGWNTLVGAHEERIATAGLSALRAAGGDAGAFGRGPSPGPPSRPYGDGRAAERVVELLGGQPLCAE